MTTFAAELQTAIARRSTTAKQIAASVGLAPRSLWVYTTGRRVPTLEIADRLAEALDSPALRQIMLTMYVRDCARCRRRFYAQNVKTVRYCSRRCLEIAYKRRIGKQAGTAKGRRLNTIEKAVDAMCRSCEVERICRDGSCPLRAFSPFPLIARRAA